MKSVLPRRERVLDRILKMEKVRCRTKLWGTKLSHTALPPTPQCPSTMSNSTVRQRRKIDTGLNTNRAAAEEKYLTWNEISLARKVAAFVVLSIFFWTIFVRIGLVSWPFARAVASDAGFGLSSVGPLPVWRSVFLYYLIPYSIFIISQKLVSETKF